MNVLTRVLAAAVMAGAVAIPAVPAAADECPAVMTFEFDPQQGALVLAPASVTVANGTCVTFNNQTATPAEFAVGSGYRKAVPPFSETVGDGNYQANSPGTTQPVTATGPTGSASGSIVIQGTPGPGSSPTAPPASSPAPPPSSPPPASSSPAPQPSPARSSKKPPAPAVTASAPPVLPLTSSSPGQPPLVEGLTTPTPSTSSSSPAVVAGSLQPPTGRGTGLPAALAALAIVGTAFALLRVLLAYPISAVDGAHSVRASS